MNSERWDNQAACKGLDPSLFFDDISRNLFRIQARCRLCPVLAECRTETDRLEGNVPPGGLAGYFAGETPRERWKRRTAQTTLRVISLNNSQVIGGGQ